MIRSSKKTQKRRRMITELDKAARERVFERDGGICIRCGDKSRIPQWAHVLSRRHLCTRWEADNAMSLCGGCHLFWHHEPALAVDWFIKNFRERWERITAILQVNPKISVRNKYLELQ